MSEKGQETYKLMRSGNPSWGLLRGDGGREGFEQVLFDPARGAMYCGPSDVLRYET
jgi:hypothetical protein